MTTQDGSVTWDDIKDHGSQILFDSLTSRRVPALHIISTLLRSNDSQRLTEDKILLQQVAVLVLKTYNYYQDAVSRDAAARVLEDYVKYDSKYLKVFVKYIYDVALKSGNLALSDLLTLLAWINRMSLLVFAEQETRDAEIEKNTISAQALLLDSCASGSFEEDRQKHKPLHRKRVYQASLAQTKYTITQTLLTSQLQTAGALIDKYVTSALAIANTSAALLFLGVLADALHDLQPVQPSFFHHLQESSLQESVMNYFIQALLGKVTPTAYALGLFTKWYIVHFTTARTFISVVLPTLEKAILRSSEVGFCHLTIPIFLNLSLDLSEVFVSSKLFTHILTGLKATKENVREKSYETLTAILANNVSTVLSENLSKIVDELLKTYKGTSNADSKILVVKGLKQIRHSSPEVATKILNGLLPIISKELNEATLTALVQVFSSEYVTALSNQWSEDEKIVAQFKSGLENPKLQLRKIWSVELGQVLFSNSALASKDAIVKFFASISPSMAKSLDEAIASPLLTVTNRGIASAYVYLALKSRFQGEGAQKLHEAALADSDDKYSILVSPKVIVKLLGAEQEWCLRALVASFEQAGNESAFGFSFLYFAISRNVSFQTRREALESLKVIILLDAEKASRAVLTAVQAAMLSSEQTSPEYDFNYELKYISQVANVLVQISDKDLALKNLTQLLVAAHHASIPVKEGWVGLALRASLDPGVVVASNAEAILTELYNVLDTTQTNSPVFQAACKSIGTVSFVKPEIVAPKLTVLFQQDLNVENIADVDETAVKIWKSPEGEVVVDVINQGEPKKVEDKNSKDYETKKWEESLKKEIALKNKSTRKLTREEHALVAQQLAKEAEIRNKLLRSVKKFYRAFYVIRELSEGNANGIIGYEDTDWFLVAVNSMLALLNKPISFALLGEFGAETFIKTSKIITSRLGALKELAGVAILRAYDVQGVPENFMENSLLSLLGKVLFRVKILADDFFDKLSFIYILPLLTRVLEKGKDVAIKNSKKQVVTSEFSDEDPEEEQLLLAIDIISSQAQLFEDQSIPRELILNVLLSLMRVPSKTKIAKECFLTLCQHISVSIGKSDLNLLMTNIITPDTFVKTAILQGFDSEFDLAEEVNYSSELWIACHDNDSNVAEIASTIWEDSNLLLVPDAPSRLLAFVSNEDTGLRLTVAKSIVSAVKALLETDEEVFSKTLSNLLELFRKKEVPPPAPLDKFGLPMTNHSSQKDAWEDRSTIALTIKLMSLLFVSASSIESVFRFLVDEETLGDQEQLVAQELLDAGVEIIKDHGLNHVETLIPIFEKGLAQEDKGSVKHDRIRESVIILYGALGRHLDASDERLTIIVDRLLATLDTPSEDVQYAVSDCIAPLVKSIEPRLQEHLDALFEKLWNGKKLAIRKGAAYGISGLVKGAGIKSLFSNDVMRNITYAADDKKNEHMREGVSFVFDCLSQSLGPLFEPYVIEVLPLILKSLGDPSPEVREATNLAARQIMKSTTSYGVKKLIPLAISNLDDIAWRSKKGSVELLGSMAYLDPTQLSASLSTIVPEIVGVLNDSHKEVRKAADQALKRFGDVIRNPEIQVIVPDLIRAIGDPTKYTDEALDKLIKTQFVHYIDGPSLALIIHVIHRGMRDRSASTKRKACQIVGNMAILVDSKDLLPYLPTLVGELEVAMVDPVPATRSTGARALGSLVEKLGEDKFPDLIPRLTATLNDVSKAGDRLGSAQALAEVICGLGLSKLDEMLPSILSSAASPYSHVRAGFMPLLLFLPVCFGSQFAPYLSSIIPPILGGLADTDEDIRDTALRAGRLIVKNYANKAVDLLLPELERGLSDSSYRIRLSSVELTGDLLFQVTGISGKNELSEEQVEVNRNLVEVLGQERRDRILAALFVCRSDVTGVVRAAGIDIWKALVANTPRTVKEIIPSLTQIIVRRCASSDETQRTIAAATLGEVVRRVGTNALNQLLPSLEESLISGDTDAKQGICIALTELITSASMEALTNHQEVFIRIIRDALVDASPAVREAAAQAFDVLQEQLGNVVIDEILPNLLVMLESDDSENALLALQDLMATKADVIFPILIPTLLSPPIDGFKVKALSSLASVAGSALYHRLASIVNTLLQAVIDAKKSGSVEEQEEVQEAFDKILLSIDDDHGVHPIMQQLMSLVKHQDSEKRAAICERLGVFFTNTSLDYSIYVQDMATQLILSLGDKDETVVKGVFDALSALVKAQDKLMLEKLVKPAQQALSIAGVRGEELPGFTLPKGPSCILPIFSHGLMYGNSEQRELSALAIAEIIDRTPAANLKPFATTITGPLIRVIGERVSSDIKSAILTALTNLLLKIPQFLRPFIPQLQRTFVRSLSDSTNEKLRNGAVTALGVLIEFQPRVDSLVAELVSGARNSDDQAIKNTMSRGILQVVVKGSKNMSEASKTSIMTLVEEEINTVNDKSAVAYAVLLGSLSQILSTEEAASILKNKILSKRNGNDELKFATLSINSFLKDAPKHIFQTGLLEEIVHFVLDCANSQLPYISDNAIVAVGKLLLLQGEVKSPKQATADVSETPFEIPDDLLKQLIDQVAKSAVSPNSNSSDTRRLALVIARTVSRFKYEELVKPNWSVLVPAVFSCLRDSIIPIRLAAEKSYLAIFNLVDDVEQKDFASWFDVALQSPITTLEGAVIQPRSIGDYTKRVATRLASVERERLEAGGDAEAMFSDLFEDESEVWAVGGH